MIKKTTRVSSYELLLKIEPQKGSGFVAKSVVWPDCYAQGDSVDEAVLEVTAVARSLIELYKEESIKIPLKLTQKGTVSGPITVPVIVST